MKRNNEKINEVQEFRFFKSSLPKIVWDPDNNRPLADFDGGSFITHDKRIALLLLDKGYPQIPVDASEPPDILVRIPGKSLGKDQDIKVGLGGTNQSDGVQVPVIQQGA